MHGSRLGLIELNHPKMVGVCLTLPDSRKSQLPSLFRRLEHDPTRERLAYRKWSSGDPEGCRKDFEALGDRLCLVADRVPAGAVESLLLDLLQRLNQHVNHSPKDRGRFHATRATLIEAFCSCESLEQASAAFNRALQQMIDSDSSRPKPNLLIEGAKAEIDLHYMERISLSSIANQLHVSASYLSRLFRRETGETLTMYVQRVRIRHARELLAGEPQRRLSEIAYQVGYRNYRDFYRNFVKHESASPRDVRRTLNRAG